MTNYVCMCSKNKDHCIQLQLGFASDNRLGIEEFIRTYPEFAIRYYRIRCTAEVNFCNHSLRHSYHSMLVSSVVPYSEFIGLAHSE